MPGAEDAVAAEKPSPARMYDYFLHGDNNFPVDREAGDAVIDQVGEVLTKDVVWENRRFLGRVVHHLAAEHGVRQFIDVGAGLPSMENTHQIARRSIPDARVAYVDLDPVVATHGKTLLTEEEQKITRLLTADLRDPLSIVDNPELADLIDFTQPVALLCVAVFHFITDEDDPHGIIRTFRERLAPGSFLALSHLNADESPDDEQDTMRAIYRNATSPMVFRTRAEIEALFSGFTLQAPGLVPTGHWRREGDTTRRMYGGLGRLG
ncbi:SAM-dependent methyltransferase [Amycolatopsis sp. cmx-4-83]|uniref:SAM-dependent methyltransferase n=1 Tax=Amycolatopsis sp. cmx-4-83 TaxID=2790940 RepID=UPI00397937A2